MARCLERVGRPRCRRASACAGCRNAGVLVEGHLAVERDDRPSGVATSGLTSTSVASSSTKTSHSFCRTSTTWSRTVGREPGRVGDLARPSPRRRRRSASTGDPGQRVRPLDGELLDLHAALDARPSPGRCGWPGRAGTRRSTPRRCRWPRSTSTRCTVWPLMSMPRMSLGAVSAPPAGSSANFTPPALPRPPVLTCALTTTTGAAEPLGGGRAASSAVVGDLAGQHRDAVRRRTGPSPGTRTDPRATPALGAAHGVDGRLASVVPARARCADGDVRPHPVDDLASVAPGVKTLATPSSLERRRCPRRG